MVVTDIDALKKKVKESGLKTAFICEKLNLTRSGWCKKLNGKSPFKVAEIQILCDILGITSLREKDQIFFHDV